MTDIAHLRALLAAASARPWRADRTNAHGGKIYDSPGRIGTVDQVASVHCGGDCGTGPANLELITAAVNSLEALLDVAEAAQAWSKEVGGSAVGSRTRTQGRRKAK